MGNGRHCLVLLSRTEARKRPPCHLFDGNKKLIAEGSFSWADQQFEEILSRFENYMMSPEMVARNYC
jgi:hypothetical protein